MPDPGNPLLAILASLGITKDPQRMNPISRQVLQTPFVRDTLAALAGGMPPVIEAPGMHDIRPWSPNFGGTVEGAALPLGDRSMVILPKGGVLGTSPEIAQEDRRYETDRTLTHEMGHISDFRDVLPEMDRIADRYFAQAKKTRPQDYGATDKWEFKAELFTHALNTLRVATAIASADPKLFGGPEAAIQYVNEAASGNRSGLLETVNAILNQPIYKNNPLRGKLPLTVLPAMKAAIPKKKAAR